MTAKWRFDLSAGTPTYYGIVCVGQSFRAIATMAATAVAMVGLLPAAHVHDGDQHQVVHRHVIGDGSAHHDPSPHHAEVDPANHDDARVLTLSYETASPFSLTRHLAVTTLSFIEPRAAHETPIIRTTHLPTHDPPLRFTSSPAPPAVV